MEGPVKKTTVDLQSSSAGSCCTTGSQEYGRLHLVDMHPSSGDPTTCTCSCLANSLVETEWYVGCMYGTYKYNPFCATSIHGDARPHTNYILHILSSSSTSTIYQLQVCLTSSSTRAGMEGDNADKQRSSVDAQRDDFQQLTWLYIFQKWQCRSKSVLHDGTRRVSASTHLL